MALIGWIGGRAAPAPYVPGVAVGCVDSDEELERLKSLTVAALDMALQDQLQHLFAIWIRDPRDQPKRAQVGASNAIGAWLGARQAAGTFQPPRCPR